MERNIFTNITLEEFRSIIQGCIKEELKDSLKPIPLPDPDILLNIQEVQSLLGVSKVTIHKWKKKGLMPFHKISRRLYFKKSEILESLKMINYGK